MVSRSLVYGLNTPIEALKRTLCIAIRPAKTLNGAMICPGDCSKRAWTGQNIPEVDQAALEIKFGILWIQLELVDNECAAV